jgi:hypothetical protein
MATDPSPGLRRSTARAVLPFIALCGRSALCCALLSVSSVLLFPRATARRDPWPSDAQHVASLSARVVLLVPSILVIPPHCAPAILCSPRSPALGTSTCASVALLAVASVALLAGALLTTVAVPGLVVVVVVAGP